MDDEKSREAKNNTDKIILSIVLCTAAQGLLVTYFATRLPESNPYAKCQEVLGYDPACRSEVTEKILMRPRY